MISFANPWGLLGLLALPAIVVLHLYHRRFPTLLIAGLHLWGAESEVRRPGRRRDRLPMTASLLLELLAALILSLVLSQPRQANTRGVEHLVFVLDNSASMQARPPGEPSFREAAVAEIGRRIEKAPQGSVATVIVTGRRPELLAGPAVEMKKAQAALDHWRPNAPAHDFQPAWDLAAQLAEGGGRIVFLTDHLPPKSLAVPKTMEIVSVGRSLENTAITAARWGFDTRANKGQIFLRIANFGRQADEVTVRGTKGDRTLFQQTVALKPGGDTALTVDVPGGLGEISVDSASTTDRLGIDNHVTLIEPKVRTVSVAITLPTNHAAVKPVQRALAGLADIQFAPAADARLVIGPATNLPVSSDELWWLGIGPIDPSDAARKQAKDLAGPYLLEKRHPLLDGVVLGGVFFGGVQPVRLEASPLVSSGQQLLLGRVNGTHTSAFLLNLDFVRSNLAESPDWPILVKNLVDLCRDGLPGLKRWNYRLNEEITFRVGAAGEGRPGDSDSSLTLLKDGKTRTLAHTAVVEIPPLEETGVYEVRDQDRSIGRFAVNFHDPVESSLTSLGPGVRDAVTEVPELSYRLEDPFSWLIAGGIAAILGLVLADWFVLRPKAGFGLKG